MAPEGTKQKLTAILSADVKDYSRLLSQDRVGTIKTLNAHREMFTNFVTQYDGHIVDMPGDNILAAFESVSDAVNCAVEIQRNLAERNAEMPSARMMQWRIGINLGDVVEEGDRIYGDGVNIAARIESLADGGGICISGTVYDQVVNKLGLEYEFLGEQEVKNIERPVRIYRILSFPGGAAHSVVKAKGDVTRKWRNTALTLVAVVVLCVGAVVIWNYNSRSEIQSTGVIVPEKPSIAVLPFTNMSDDPEQEYFSDGMTEEIINLLSKSQSILVIARNSTFTYKGKPVKVQQVSQELGAKYVLEGSVRKVGDKIRITAQLIDATTGNHIWSEKYDKELKDIFALQDEIAQQIAINLLAEYKESEFTRIRRIPTDNLTAHDSYMRGLEQIYKFTKEANTKARDYFERAMKIDPMYADAYAFCGLTYLFDREFGWNRDPQIIKKVYEFALKAIDLDKTNARARYLMAWVYNMQNKIEQAISELNRAISLNPNDDDSYMLLGRVLSAAGRHEEGIELLETTIRLNPLHHADVIYSLGRVYEGAGQYEDAIEAYKKAILRDPNYFPAYQQLSLVYAFQWYLQKSHDPQILDRALEMAQKAVALDETNSDTRTSLGWVYLNRGQQDQAIEELEKAIMLDPNNYSAYRVMSQVYMIMGKSTESVEIAHKANELTPENPSSGNWFLGQAYFFA